MKNDLLINKCIENARSLIKDQSGEFYPFGYTTKDYETASKYYVYDENDYPDVNDVLIKLATFLVHDLNKRDYVEVAICSLCEKIVDGVKFVFLDIKQLSETQEVKDDVILIDINYDDYTFEIIERIECVGTIKSFYNSSDPYVADMKR